MPSFQGQISEEQLLQVVAYVKSLSTAKPETSTAKPPPASATPNAKPSASPKKK
jgi:mono/diheme cytochrome c family protein